MKYDPEQQLSRRTQLGNSIAQKPSLEQRMTSPVVIETVSLASFLYSWIKWRYIVHLTKTDAFNLKSLKRSALVLKPFQSLKHESKSKRNGFKLFICSIGSKH